MTADEPTTALPKLRFPEFRSAGTWRFQPLGEIAESISARVGATKCVPMSVTTGRGLVSQEEKFGRTIAGDSYKNYIRLQANDFAYNKSATKEYPQGYIARYSGTRDAAVPNSIFSCFRPDATAVVPEYLDHLFHGNHHGRWLRKYITVGARAHGALSVSDDALMSMPVPLPPLAISRPEQQKIADCLGSLDDLIAAEGRKLEALRQHKQGLMQQLFPQLGETVPRLRFPEFHKAGEWAPTTIGEHVDLLTGFPFDGKDIVDDRAGTPLMRGVNVTEGRVRHYSDIDRYYLGPTQKLEKYTLRAGDLVIGMDGSKVGRNSALVPATDAGALLVQRVARLRSDQQVIINFIFHHVNSRRFHGYVDRINTSSGIPHISAKQIMEFPFSMPDTAEQQRISDCLFSLDAQLSAQDQKLDGLKRYKQGLLQQLFPSLEDEPR